MIARRWFHLTPDRFVIGLLVVECLIWLSNSLHLFAKGWAALTAIAFVAAILLSMLIWFAVNLMLHRRFQFSVRSLFALILAVAIPCGWFVIERDRAGRQNETAKWIKSRIGGLVKYDWELDSDGTYRSSAEPSGPVWLRDLLGGDFFDEIEEVSFSGVPVTDAAAERIKELTRLRYLWLDNGRITDGAFSDLKGLTELRTLVLDWNLITDAGLQDVQGFSQLSYLSIKGAHITDAGLVYLRGLSQLRQLHLEQTLTTDPEVRKLRVHCGLHCLSWRGYRGNSMHQVVIIGGGFGGLYLARHLKRRRSRSR